MTYPSEYLLHKACIEYLELACPDVFFYSDLNGIRVTRGTAGKIKAIQMKYNKWLDIFLPEPRRQYHGLFIELKNGPQKVFKKDGSLKRDDHLEAQQATIDHLIAKDYYACFSSTFEHFTETVNWYLSLDGDKPRIEL